LRNQLWSFGWLKADTDFPMRIITLLGITLLGGVAGFFVGGYSYNFVHPIRTTQATHAPRGGEPDSQLKGLQVAVRGTGDALEHHVWRHHWLIVGALAGATVGFVGTVLLSRHPKSLPE
jgi:hypothetical protein